MLCICLSICLSIHVFLHQQRRKNITLEHQVSLCMSASCSLSSHKGCYRNNQQHNDMIIFVVVPKSVELLFIFFVRFLVLQKLETIRPLIRPFFFISSYVGRRAKKLFSFTRTRPIAAYRYTKRNINTTIYS